MVDLGGRARRSNIASRKSTRKVKDGRDAIARTVRLSGPMNYS
jgi:hypothetical protein